MIDLLQGNTMDFSAPPMPSPPDRACPCDPNLGICRVSSRHNQQAQRLGGKVVYHPLNQVPDSARRRISGTLNPLALYRGELTRHQPELCARTAPSDSIAFHVSDVGVTKSTATAVESTRLHGRAPSNTLNQGREDPPDPIRAALGPEKPLNGCVAITDSRGNA